MAAAPAVLFVFVVTDQSMAMDILDLVTGKTAAALATVSAQTEDVLRQAEAISTESPVRHNT
jgi:hypothetical protein